jgi:drug/metabolite transporter (DMT)-like permease
MAGAARGQHCALIAGPSSRGLGSHRGAVLLALFVTLLWSSSWVLIRWGLEGEALPPLTFAALRYCLAAVVLLVALALQWRRAGPAAHGVAPMARLELTRLVALGVAMYALTQGAIFVALDRQPAAATSLVLSATPLLVAGVAAISLAEVPSRVQVVGALAVLAGAALYLSGDLGGTVAGMFAAGVALSANVSASILGRDINRSRTRSALTVTTVSMSAGALVLAGLALLADGLPEVSVRGWAIVVWLALVNTALAFTLWNLTLQRLSAVESASINNTMLVQISILAWVFLAEAPGVLGIAGIALVTAGVYLVQSRRWAGTRPVV